MMNSLWIRLAVCALSWPVVEAAAAGGSWFDFEGAAGDPLVADGAGHLRCAAPPIALPDKSSLELASHRSNGVRGLGLRLLGEAAFHGVVCSPAGSSSPVLSPSPVASWEASAWIFLHGHQTEPMLLLFSGESGLRVGIRYDAARRSDVVFVHEKGMPTPCETPAAFNSVETTEQQAGGPARRLARLAWHHLLVSVVRSRGGPAAGSSEIKIHLDGFISSCGAAYAGPAGAWSDFFALAPPPVTHCPFAHFHMLRNSSAMTVDGLAVAWSESPFHITTDDIVRQHIRLAVLPQEAIAEGTPPNPNQHLAAHWTFDAEGSVAHDVSGHGRHAFFGTLGVTGAGAATTEVDALAGRSAVAENSSWWDVGSAEDFDWGPSQGAEVSVTGWWFAKGRRYWEQEGPSQELSQIAHVFAVVGNGTDGLRVVVERRHGRNGARVVVFVNEEPCFGRFTIRDGSAGWWFLACTISAGRVSVYINGVLNTVCAMPTANRLIVTPREHVRLGSDPDDTSALFPVPNLPGLVDDVRVYNTRLRAVSIRACMQAVMPMPRALGSMLEPLLSVDFEENRKDTRPNTASPYRRRPVAVGRDRSPSGLHLSPHGRVATAPSYPGGGVAAVFSGNGRLDTPPVHIHAPGIRPDSGLPLYTRPATELYAAGVITIMCTINPARHPHVMAVASLVSRQESQDAAAHASGPALLLAVGPNGGYLFLSVKGQTCYLNATLPHRWTAVRAVFDAKTGAVDLQAGPELRASCVFEGGFDGFEVADWGQGAVISFGGVAGANCTGVLREWCGGPGDGEGRNPLGYAGGLDDIRVHASSVSLSAAAGRRHFGGGGYLQRHEMWAASFEGEPGSSLVADESPRRHPAARVFGGASVQADGGGSFLRVGASPGGLALGPAVAFQSAAAAEFTFTAWIRPEPDTTPQDGRVELILLSTTSLGFYVAVSPHPLENVAFLTVTTPNASCAHYVPYEPFAWQHVAVVLSKLTGEAALYRNAKLVGSCDAFDPSEWGDATVFGPSPQGAGAAEELLLLGTAKNQPGVVRAFRGSLKGVKLYDAQLSEGQVEAVMLGLLGRAGAGPKGGYKAGDVLVWYRFDEFSAEEGGGVLAIRDSGAQALHAKAVAHPGKGSAPEIRARDPAGPDARTLQSYLALRGGGWVPLPLDAGSAFDAPNLLAALWFRPSGAGGQQMLLSCLPAFAMVAEADGAVGCSFQAVAVRSGARIVPVGRWTHLACYWSGDAIQLYVNGTLQQVVSTGVPRELHVWRASHFSVGPPPEHCDDPTAPCPDVHGDVDDVILYRSGAAASVPGVVSGLFSRAATVRIESLLPLLPALVEEEEPSDQCVEEAPPRSGDPVAAWKPFASGRASLPVPVGRAVSSLACSWPFAAAVGSPPGLPGLRELHVFSAAEFAEGGEQVQGGSTRRIRAKTLRSAAPGGWEAPPVSQGSSVAICGSTVVVAGEAGADVYVRQHDADEWYHTQNLPPLREVAGGVAGTLRVWGDAVNGTVPADAAAFGSWVRTDGEGRGFVGARVATVPNEGRLVVDLGTVRSITRLRVGSESCDSRDSCWLQAFTLSTAEASSSDAAFAPVLSAGAVDVFRLAARPTPPYFSSFRFSPPLLARQLALAGFQGTGASATVAVEVYYESAEPPVRKAGRPSGAGPRVHLSSRHAVVVSGAGGEVCFAEDGMLSASSADPECQANWGASWCPAGAATGEEWLQADLRAAKPVESVAVAPGATRVGGREAVLAYRLLLRNDTGAGWLDLGEEATGLAAGGATSPGSSVRIVGLTARYIRWVPTDYETWPSMRVSVRVACPTGGDRSVVLWRKSGEGWRRVPGFLSHSATLFSALNGALFASIEREGGAHALRLWDDGVHVASHPVENPAAVSVSDDGALIAVLTSEPRASRVELFKYRQRRLARASSRVLLQEEQRSGERCREVSATNLPGPRPRASHAVFVVCGRFAFKYAAAGDTLEPADDTEAPAAIHASCASHGAFAYAHESFLHMSSPHRAPHGGRLELVEATSRSAAAYWVPADATLRGQGGHDTYLGDAMRAKCGERGDERCSFDASGAERAVMVYRVAESGEISNVQVLDGRRNALAIAGGTPVATPQREQLLLGVSGTVAVSPDGTCAAVTTTGSRLIRVFEKIPGGGPPAWAAAGTLGYGGDAFVESLRDLNDSTAYGSPSANRTLSPLARLCGREGTITSPVDTLLARRGEDVFGAGLSLGAWVRLSTARNASGFDSLVSCAAAGGASSPAFELRYSSEQGNLAYTTRVDTVDFTTATDVATPQRGPWVHVSVVHSWDSRVALLVDGKRVATGKVPLPAKRSQKATAPWDCSVLGGGGARGGVALREVYVWAASADEETVRHVASGGAPPDAVPGLVLADGCFSAENSGFGFAVSLPSCGDVLVSAPLTHGGVVHHYSRVSTGLPAWVLSHRLGPAAPARFPTASAFGTSLAVVPLASTDLLLVLQSPPPGAAAGAAAVLHFFARDRSAGGAWLPLEPAALPCANAGKLAAVGVGEAAGGGEEARVAVLCESPASASSSSPPPSVLLLVARVLRTRRGRGAGGFAVAVETLWHAPAGSAGPQAPGGAPPPAGSASDPRLLPGASRAELGAVVHRLPHPLPLNASASPVFADVSRLRQGYFACRYQLHLDDSDGSALDPVHLLSGARVACVYGGATEGITCTVSGRVTAGGADEAKSCTLGFRAAAEGDPFVFSMRYGGDETLALRACFGACGADDASFVQTCHRMPRWDSDFKFGPGLIGQAGPAYFLASSTSDQRAAQIESHLARYPLPTPGAADVDPTLTDTSHVVLFKDTLCEGPSVAVAFSSGETSCERCWDACGKEYSDGSAVSSVGSVRVMAHPSSTVALYSATDTLRFVGCYTEAAGEPAGNFSVFKGSSQTVSSCRIHCEGYPLFALREASCFCGQAHAPEVMSPVPTSLCGPACAGETATGVAQLHCGTPTVHALYSNEGACFGRWHHDSPAKKTYVSAEHGCTTVENSDAVQHARFYPSSRGVDTQAFARLEEVFVTEKSVVVAARNMLWVMEMNEGRIVQALSSAVPEALYPTSVAMYGDQLVVAGYDGTAGSSLTQYIQEADGRFTKVQTVRQEVQPDATGVPRRLSWSAVAATSGGVLVVKADTTIECIVHDCLCSGRGMCKDATGVCECENGYDDSLGVNCEVCPSGMQSTDRNPVCHAIACYADCSGHGTCGHNAECMCQAGYTGEHCQAVVPCDAMAKVSSNPLVCPT
ncbi:hypothetical protein DIPPA_18254 [Diplonema papillatum]|nr:hypothetical protein DIPPA_18254 [Diplonema papillatum]